MADAISAQSAPAALVGQSVVLAGAFDPMLFQPSYLAEQGLLSEGDLTQLGYQVMAPELTVMTLPWMQVIAEPTKLVASTTPEIPLWEPVWDFVFSFYQVLKLKRISAVGLNYDTHFAVPSEQIWHSVGHHLVPKDHLWSKVLVNPGTASMTIKGGRDDDLPGHVNVKVEPSIRLHPGIYVSVNDHMEFGSSESERAIITVGQKLVTSRKRCDEIVGALKDLAR